MSNASHTIDVAALHVVRRGSVNGTNLRNLFARIAAALKGAGKPSADVTRLYRLNDHVLRDIGLSRHEIGNGPMESFWRH